jgi:resuscitation-promoting factor RpfB
MSQVFGIGLITLLAVFSINSPNITDQNIDADVKSASPIHHKPTNNLQPVNTQTRFDEIITKEEEIIPFKIIYKDDPDVEAGVDQVLHEGINGRKITTIKTLYYEGDIYSQETIGIETIVPEDKIISRGTKKIWRTVDTQDGTINYWKKMRVYATHYDSTCLGCNEWTALGMRQGKGIIAVDPRVIRLRSNVYIPGYGHAVAGDTGGAIKGNIIDLGFDDARTAGWSARYVDIYLLD